LCALFLGSAILPGCNADRGGGELALSDDGLTQCSDPESPFPALFNRSVINRELATTPALRSAFGASEVNTCEEALHYRSHFMAYETSQLRTESDQEEPPAPQGGTEKIHVGTGVRSGFGIVEILTSANVPCTAFFITDRHLYTAAHCFGKPGEEPRTGNQSITYRARDLPTGSRQQTGIVHIPDTYSSGHRSDDVAIVALAFAEPWATAQNRFRLYVGPTVVGTNLQIYGYGANVYAGTGGGSLRVGKDRTPIRLAAHQDGYFRANANTARTCLGDSGGPAIKEGAALIVWGSAAGFKSSYNDACPHSDEEMFWAKTGYNINSGFVEGALGFSCRRGTSEGQAYLQCW
jgi:hypothetical protein